MHRPLRSNLRSPLLAVGAVAAAVASIASVAGADVTLTSPDGRWVATIKEVGGGAGQCTSMKDTSLPANEQPFLANTIHYVRMGSAVLFPAAETARMENLFSCARFVAESDNFTAVLVANDLSGTVAMVNGEMVPGAAGGLRVAITFMDAAPTSIALAHTSVKPFVYANLNVDGQMLGNVGGWAPGSPDSHVWQKRNGSASNSERWFVGVDPDGVQAMSDSFMMNALDDGLLELSGALYTGPGDMNAAMSWPEADINDVALTATYGVGNVGLFVAPAFGAAPDGSAVIRSGDLRWLCQMLTSGQLAGQVQFVRDQSQVGPGSVVADVVVPFAGIGPAGTEEVEPFYATLTRLHMWIPGSSRRSSTIIRHSTQPGVITIMDGLMASGEAGGYVASHTWVDTTGAHPTIRPFVYADVDVDDVSINQGDLAGDHLWMTAPSSGTGNVRWARSTFFGSFMLGTLPTVWATLFNSQPLANTAYTLPADLEFAFGYPAKQLATAVPYVYGYAIGNPNIAIPAGFCTPTFDFPCPADIDTSGTVDAADLSILLGAWGPWQPTSRDTDLNDDGMTDAADLSILLGAWGGC